MKLDFKKIGSSSKSVQTSSQEGHLEGELQRDKELVDFQGILRGDITVYCKRCGEEFYLPICEKLHLKLSDGIYRGFDEEADVIEFFDGKIDFDYLINSEMEAIKSDYHLCPVCKLKEGEENGSTQKTCE